MDRGAWPAIVHEISESETTERLTLTHAHTHTHTHTHTPHGGSCNLFVAPEVKLCTKPALT